MIKFNGVSRIVEVRTSDSDSWKRYMVTILVKLDYGVIAL